MVKCFFNFFKFKNFFKKIIAIINFKDLPLIKFKIYNIWSKLVKWKKPPVFLNSKNDLSLFNKNQNELASITTKSEVLSIKLMQQKKFLLKKKHLENYVRIMILTKNF